MTFDERLNQMELEIKKPSFRYNKGLGNEVGYYIFDYPAEEELKVRERVEYIRKKHMPGASDFEVAVFDLYDILIDMLNEKGYLEKCCEFEKKRGFDYITQAVGHAMRLTTEDNLIINYIKDHTPANCVVFITGVGKVYPILRSHTILNNLHIVLDSVPVVMFYPGKYDGQELILFGEIKDDNYYRAFKLVN